MNASTPRVSSTPRYACSSSSRSGSSAPARCSAMRTSTRVGAGTGDTVIIGAVAAAAAVTGGRGAAVVVAVVVAGFDVGGVGIEVKEVAGGEVGDGVNDRGFCAVIAYRAQDLKDCRP
ncbi:hypothetical protein VTK26DRAFT_2892 [Humicola hyalothermophila]